MPDQNLNPVGCLGRALTFLGIVWIGIVVLVSIGVVSDGAVGGGFLAGIGGSIIPGILLLAAGRGLRRRAKMMEGQPGPVPVAQPPLPEKRVPTSRSEPTATTGPTVMTPPRLPSSEPSAPAPQAKPAPRPPDPVLPARRDVTRRLEEVIPPRDDDLADKANQTLPIDFKPPPPKTSQELIEEARRKWGRSKPR